MDDIVGKILSTIAIILFMVTFPLMMILQNNDKLIQRYVDESVENFKDKCLVSGQITEENYQNLLSSLSQTGYAFKIKLEEYDETFYMTNDNESQFAYSANDNQTIVETIFSGIRTDDNGNQHQYIGEPYIMSNGSADLNTGLNGSYLKITVESEDSTFATKMAYILTFGSISSTGIHTIDGGRVQANGIDL